MSMGPLLTLGSGRCSRQSLASATTHAPNISILILIIYLPTYFVLCMPR